MKNTIKKIIAAILCMAFALCIAACDNTDNNTDKPVTSDGELAFSDAVHSDNDELIVPNVMALKGPTGMGMAYLMDNRGEGEYNISLTTAPEDVVSSIVAGSTDIAAVPVNLAATLYNKLEGDLQMLAVNTLGVLYVLENGDSIESIEDLAGKKIYATGQASTPEYILNYILEENGLDDVEVEYIADHSELATLMAEGKADIGMLPEPNVTATMAKNKDLRIALNLTEEWEKVSDAQLAQGCIVARRDFVEENPELIETFMSDYEKSVAFVNEDEEAPELIAKYEIIAKAALAKKAIPNCNIVFITGEDMQETADGMFEVLFEANKKSVGGKIPGDDFYYPTAEKADK